MAKQSKLDRFLHHNLPDHIEITRSRILFGFLYINIVFLVFVNLMILLRYSIPQNKVSQSHYFLVAILIFYILLLLINTRKKKPRLTAHLFILFNYLLISSLSLFSVSQVSGRLVPLLYIIAIVPFLLLGAKAGMIWGAVGGLTYAVIDGLRLINRLPSAVFDSDQFLQLSPLIMMGLYFILFFTGLIYERITGFQTGQILLERNRFLSDASRDKLTGLANRSLLEDCFPYVVEQCDEDGEMLAVVYIDLDDFKPVNDNLGHSIGDSLLRDIAGKIRNTIRDSDLAVRLGGDEFLVLYRHLHNGESIVEIVEKLLSELNERTCINGNEIEIKASAGIVIYPLHIRDAGDLINAADQCMYEAKRRKSGYFIFGSD